MPENAPGTADRPHPITPADRSAAACEALACAAAQLRDVAESDDPQALPTGRETDVIWTLRPWQLAAVATWLQARSDLYRTASDDG
jgi:hypothetical protein